MPLRFQEIDREYSRIFAEWRKHERLEEQTCRPIIDGKRFAPVTDLVTLVCLGDGDAVIGRFSYFDLNSRNRSAEFGYVVNPELRNRGYGTKMVTYGIDYLFSQLDLNKAYCQTGAFNVASVRLLERLGFHKDAVLRQHHELDGRFFDDLIYSQLRSEWNERNSKQ